MKIINFINGKKTIEKILRHIGLLENSLRGLTGMPEIMILPSDISHIFLDLPAMRIPFKAKQPICILRQ